MMIATHSEIASHGEVYRAARLEHLARRMMRHIERTDAWAHEVEQALAKLAEANRAERH